MYVVRSIGWGFLTCLALTIGTGAWEYVLGDPMHLDSLFREKYVRHLALVRLHGVTAILSLVLGPFQFWNELRVHQQSVHRVMGWLYALAVILASVTGFAMGTDAEGGLVAQAGFCALSVAWLATLVRAVGAALRRDIQTHRRWMTRCFVLTFSAVVSRVALVGLMDAGLVFEHVYPYVAWLSWTAPLLLTELLRSWASQETDVQQWRVG